jgi:nucleotide-binding universal stress UspA family protein
MIRCVLVATDGSEPSIAAVATAIEIVQSLGPHARLHAATVMDYAELPDVMAKHPAAAPDLLAERADAALEQVTAAAATAGIAVQTHRLTGAVVDALSACAEEVGAGLLVAGFHGRNRIARLVMGSVAGGLVRSSAIPVVVVRGHPA